MLSPPESEKEKRNEGMSKSQKNIDFLHKNTNIYHTRAERTAYMATMFNKDFVNYVATSQTIYDFITGDKLSKNFVNPKALEVTKYALNCRNPDIVLYLRKLNARPKNDAIDRF